jgi:hypothetical protein
MRARAVREGRREPAGIGSAMGLPLARGDNPAMPRFPPSHDARAELPGRAPPCRRACALACAIVATWLLAGCASPVPVVLQSTNDGGERAYAGSLSLRGTLVFAADASLRFEPADGEPVDAALRSRSRDFEIRNQDEILQRFALDRLARQIDSKTTCALSMDATLRLDEFLVGPESAWVAAHVSDIVPRGAPRLVPCRGR